VRKPRDGVTLKQRWSLPLTAIAFLAMAATVFAGTGGADLNPLWTDISNTIQGPGGKILAVMGFLGGLYAIMRGQAGIGAVLLLSIMAGGMLPTVIDSKFTALF